MTLSQIRFTAYKVLLALAYFLLIFEWFWILLVGLPPLIDSGALDVLTNSPEVQPVVKSEPVEMNPLTWAFVGLVTIGILVITVIALIRLPKAVVKVGQQFVEQTSSTVIPVVTHHKPVSVKKRRQLSRRIILFVQLMLTIIPLVISLFLPPYQELTKQIIITVATWLALLCALTFFVSWLLQPLATSRTRSHAFRG